MTTFSFVNHLPDNDHSRPQHIGRVSFSTIFVVFYWGVVFGINIVNWFIEWKMDNTKYSAYNQLPRKY